MKGRNVNSLKPDDIPISAAPRGGVAVRMLRAIGAAMLEGAALYATGFYVYPEGLPPEETFRSGRRLNNN
jgi:hypothetical protein